LRKASPKPVTSKQTAFPSIFSTLIDSAFQRNKEYRSICGDHMITTKIQQANEEPNKTNIWGNRNNRNSKANAPLSLILQKLMDEFGAGMVSRG
jgi:hypothetical protein